MMSYSSSLSADWCFLSSGWTLWEEENIWIPWLWYFYLLWYFLSFAVHSLMLSHINTSIWSSDSPAVIMELWIAPAKHPASNSRVLWAIMSESFQDSPSLAAVLTRHRFSSFESSALQSHLHNELMRFLSLWIKLSVLFGVPVIEV